MINETKPFIKFQNVILFMKLCEYLGILTRVLDMKHEFQDTYIYLYSIEIYTEYKTQSGYRTM